MLKIRDDVDLKELEKFGFEFYCEVKQNNTTPKFYNGFENYTEIGYRYDNGANTIDVVKERKNGNWFFQYEPREIGVYEDDYECGINEDMLDVIFDLIQAGLVEKVEE